MSPLRWHKDSIRAGPSEVGGSVLSLSPSSVCCRVVDTVACVTDGREGPVLVDRDYLPPLLNNSNGIFCTQSFVPWSVF